LRIPVILIEEIRRYRAFYHPRRTREKWGGKNNGIDLLLSWRVSNRRERSREKIRA